MKFTSGCVFANFIEEINGSISMCTGIFSSSSNISKKL